MKFKGKLFIFFILLVSLTGSGARADQDNFNQGSLKPGSLDNSVKKNRLFDGFLYFADKGGDHLKAIPKRFAPKLNSHELGFEILGALMEGPHNSTLSPTFPGDTQVRALFIAEDGKAWVDLGLRDGYLKNMDTMSELLAIYSVVNSLTLNIPGVKQVKILVNGSDAATLGGHVSLKYFYKTNMLIVK